MKIARTLLLPNNHGILSSGINSNFIYALPSSPSSVYICSLSLERARSSAVMYICAVCAHMNFKCETNKIK